MTFGLVCWWGNLSDKVTMSNNHYFMQSAYSNNHYFKYADDTALVGLLSDNETDYRSDIDHFVSRRVANCLELKLSKPTNL